ncbi:S41 family peptidase [Psychroserpens luteus]|uniref:S41 family peptidase n=1 Tax=Psychroserpens luteus TaxID=1434066 RepID=A0ABW5ZT75_9FLAO|nr:S41 family peptidase [Psychroserpens luteus]
MNTNSKSIIIFTFFSFFILVSIHAQILNNDFEISNDSIPKHPKDWKFINTNEAQFSLTSSTTSSGSKSFIVDLTNNTSNKNHYFSQVVKFQGKKLQRVLLTFYMKSDLDGTAGIWWQARDKNDMQIGFTNSGMQNQQVSNKTEWSKYTLLLTINEKCTQFIIGGYANGKGKVWFDNFKVEDIKLADTNPPKEVKAYLKAFTNIVKTHSLYKDSLNWKQIDNDLKYLSKGINSIDAVGSPKNYIINMLKEAGDNHSFIAPKIAFEKSQNSQTSTSVPYSKLLDNNIGYINVPDFSSRNDSVKVKFATKIQGLIKSLDTEHTINGWVVDLRDNPGGNMHPMLAGLGPLTGEGTSGYFISGKDKSSEAWFYKNGGFGVGHNITTQVENPYVIKQSNPKIAVLISSRTGSSGEMTAVAFIGKDNTTLFGQTSGGYTTTNQDFELPNGDRVYLASGFVADRNNVIYPKSLQPDVTVIEDGKDLDKTLEAALKWLQE